MRGACTIREESVCATSVRFDPTCVDFVSVIPVNARSIASTNETGAWSQYEGPGKC
jgi:hypothetical protein